MSRVVVVIPTYNEAETIVNVVKDVLESMRMVGR
jgi:glycosyltransferase involved in cell wall biosynthesis